METEKIENFREGIADCRAGYTSPSPEAKRWVGYPEGVDARLKDPSLDQNDMHAVREAFAAYFA